MNLYSQPFLHPHEAVILTKCWKIQHTICFGITILMFLYFFLLQVSLETLETTHRVIESFLMKTAKWALAYICKNWKSLFVKIGSIWQSKIWLWNAIKSLMQLVKKCRRLKFSLVDIHLQISARKGTSMVLALVEPQPLPQLTQCEIFMGQPQNK